MSWDNVIKFPIICDAFLHQLLGRVQLHLRFKVVTYAMFPGARFVFMAEVAHRTPPGDFPIICDAFLHQLAVHTAV